jgi:hypothetical protein
MIFGLNRKIDAISVKIKRLEKSVKEGAVKIDTSENENDKKKNARDNDRKGRRKDQDDSSDEDDEKNEY